VPRAFIFHEEGGHATFNKTLEKLGEVGDANSMIKKRTLRPLQKLLFKYKLKRKQ